MNVSNKLNTSAVQLKDLKTYQVGVIEAGAHRALRQHKDALLKNYNLTGVEWYLIGTVADAGKAGVRSTDLARSLGTTMGFLTKTITLLEAKKILTRQVNPEDARSNYIVFNERYRKTLNEIENGLRVRLRDTIYGLVTPEELAVYIQVSQKFSQL